MKRIILAALMLIGVTTFANTPPDINEKVLKAFKAAFKNATDVEWSESNDKFQANFKQQTIMTRATFDAEGTLLTTVKYYYEENLPSHIAKRLKKKHATKSVFGVTEITADEETVYYIKLQDDKNWYTIKSDCRAAFEMTEKFKKA
jgi:hypothetical protein